MDDEKKEGGGRFFFFWGGGDDVHTMKSFETRGKSFFYVKGV